VEGELVVDLGAHVGAGAEREPEQSLHEWILSSRRRDHLEHGVRVARPVGDFAAQLTATLRRQRVVLRAE
jgi:hypothetical protein